MEVHQLRYLVAVAEEGSLTQAARRLDVVQSAVSAGLRRLERELGVELLDRGARGVALTEAGRIVHAHAVRALDAMQDVRDDLAARSGGLTGLVTVGTVLSSGQIDLAELVREFRAEHPGVRVHLRLIPGPASSRLDAVRSGELDLALLPQIHPIADDIAFRPLTQARLRLVAAQDDPLVGRESVALTDLAGRTFVDFPETWGNRQLVDEHWSRHGLRRDVAIVVEEVSAALAMVRSRAGLAFVAMERLDPPPPGIAVLDVTPDLPAFSLGLSWCTSRPRSAAARLLRDWIVRSRTSPAPTGVSS